jgi:hypothetical protein
MIDPQRVAFDIDGVIADTMQLFIDIAREIHGIDHIRHNSITCYDLETCLDMQPQVIADIVQRITDGNYPCRLTPIPGAVQVLNRLRRLGPILMVTARPRLSPIKRWVDQVFNAQQGDIDIVATGSYDAKPAVLKRHGIAFFIDDRLDTCYLLQQQKITPVVFVQPWNRQDHPFVEVDGWKQLGMLIDWEPSCTQSPSNTPARQHPARVAKGTG